MMKYKCKHCGEKTTPETWCVNRDVMFTARCQACLRKSFGASRNEAIGVQFDLIESENSVEHPSHYTKHPSGVECITVTEHFNFNRGNAIKYVWRAGEKGNEIEDLKKARWYIDREIQRMEKVK